MICSFCQKECEDIKCARCKQAFYCNQECQKSHWSTHKKDCKGPPKEPPKNMDIDYFKDLSFIGQGNFSEIYAATCKYRQKSFAVKKFNKSRVKQVNKEADVRMEVSFLSQVHTLQKLDSPYISTFYHYWHDELHHYIVTELVEGGELLTLITHFGLPCHEYVQYFGLQIIEAMEYLQTKGIVHRDLKPENILLTADKMVKLIDFGTARDLQEPSIKGSGNGRPGKMQYDHFVGTPQYMPIEMIRNKDSNFASDIWSFGVVLYQMICGDWPFKGKSEYLIFKATMEEELIFPKGMFSEVVQDLLRMILVKDLKDRPTLEQIKEHAFFKGWERKTFDQIKPSQEEKKLYNIRREALKLELNTEQKIDDYYSKQEVTEWSEENLLKLEYQKERLKDRNVTEEVQDDTHVSEQVQEENNVSEQVQEDKNESELVQESQEIGYTQ